MNMKRHLELMFTAVAAGVAALAAHAVTLVPSSTTFEGWPEPAAGAKYLDNAGAPVDSGSVYWWTADEADVSTTNAWKNETSPASYPKDETGATLTKGSTFLAFGDENAGFSRALMPATRADGALEEVETEVGNGGLFIDTLVKFTASDEDPVDFEDDDRIVVWLATNSIAGGYVLRARATAFGTDVFEDGDGAVITNIVYDDVTFDLAGVTGLREGSWYRLTVKAVPDVLGMPDSQSITAFRIYLDGHELSTAKPGITQEILDLAGSTATDLLSGKFFFDRTGFATAPVLGSAQFRGAGAVDDFVVSDKNPFYAGGSISLRCAASGCTVTHAVNGGAASSAATFSAKPGDEIVFTLTPTNTAAIQLPINYISHGVATMKLEGNTWSYTVTGGEESGYLFTFTCEDSCWSARVTPEDLVPDGTAEADVPAVTAKLQTLSTRTSEPETDLMNRVAGWIEKKGITGAQINAATDEALEIAYLLNLDHVPATEEEIAAFSIPSITVQNDGTVIVGVPAGDYNGMLDKLQAVELEGPWVSESESGPLDGARFFRYRLVK